MKKILFSILFLFSLIVLASCDVLKTKYTVKFYQDETKETLLESKTVASGEQITYTGNVPVKADDDNYTYDFKGWDHALGIASKNEEFYAVFERHAIGQKFTIKFINEDGTLIYEAEFAEGAMPSCSKTPTKEGNVEFSYIFNGWDSELTAVTEDKTYTATYRAVKNKYTVKFESEGKVLSSQAYDYGTPSSSIVVPSNPTKAEDSENTYVFKGWDKQIADVTGDVTYQATFEAVSKYVTATFMNGNTKLAEVKVLKGNTPEYSGSVPTKAKDQEYIYEFSGWTPELSPITEDTSYQAQFNQINRYVTATFLNGEEVIFNAKVERGQTPIFPATLPKPTKDADEEYTYQFAGWTPELSPIAEDTSYQAKFDAISKYVIATFMNGNTKLAEVKVLKGNTPEYSGDVPTKAEDSLYTYEFKGWNPALAAISQDTTFEAVFESHEKDVEKVTVTFKNGDEVLESKFVAKGDVPVYTGETPTKEEDNLHTYTFKSWDKELVAVNEDTTYNAVFDSHDKEIVYSVIIGETSYPMAENPNDESEVFVNIKNVLEDSIIEIYINKEEYAYKVKANQDENINNLTADKKIITAGDLGFYLNLETAELWVTGYQAPQIDYFVRIGEDSYPMDVNPENEKEVFVNIDDVLAETLIKVYANEEEYAYKVKANQDENINNLTANKKIITAGNLGFYLNLETLELWVTGYQAPIVDVDELTIKVNGENEKEITKNEKFEPNETYEAEYYVDLSVSAGDTLTFFSNGVQFVPVVEDIEDNNVSSGTIICGGDVSVYIKKLVDEDKYVYFVTGFKHNIYLFIDDEKQTLTKVTEASDLVTQEELDDENNVMIAIVELDKDQELSGKDNLTPIKLHLGNQEIDSYKALLDGTKIVIYINKDNEVYLKESLPEVVNVYKVNGNEMSRSSEEDIEKSGAKDQYQYELKDIEAGTELVFLMNDEALSIDLTNIANYGNVELKNNKLVIIDGGNVSVYLKLTNDNKYQLWVSGKVEVLNTIYFTNNNNWEEVYAHYWDNDSNGTTWPGNKIEKIGQNDFGQDIYQIDLATKYVGIIFNGNQEQTVDIAIEDILENNNDNVYLTGEKDGQGHYEVGFARYNTTKYTISFYSEDGQTKLDEVIVNENAVPAYSKEENPTKESTVSHTYTFLGWADSVGGELLENLPEATEDASYYALFSELDREYTVSFTTLTGIKEIADKSIKYNQVCEFTVEFEEGYEEDELSVLNATLKEGLIYQLTVTADVVVTISGAKLKDTVKSVTVTPQELEKVTFTGENVANVGEDYTFKVNLKTGYTGTVVVSVNGSPVELEDDGSYTVSNVSQDITISIDESQVALLKISITFHVGLVSRVLEFDYNEDIVYDQEVENYEQGGKEYEFKGWAIEAEGNVLASLGKATQNKDLYAVFEAVSTYRLLSNNISWDYADGVKLEKMDELPDGEGAIAQYHLRYAFEALDEFKIFDGDKVWLGYSILQDGVDANNIGAGSDGNIKIYNTNTYNLYLKLYQNGNNINYLLWIGAESNSYTILHAFNWSYENIKHEMNNISEAGFTAIQISPVQQPIYYSAYDNLVSGQWHNMYQPVTFSIASNGTTWLGTKDQLISMINEAHKYDIKIIVDIIANHVGGSGQNVDSKAKQNIPGVENYLHSYLDPGQYDTVEKIVRGNIGMPDLDTSSSFIQGKVVDLLKECIDAGVDGFRFDAAKHIETPNDGYYASDFWPNVINQATAYAVSSQNKTLYYYGEILGAGPNRSMNDYTPYMSVTESATSGDVRYGVAFNDIDKAMTGSYWGGEDPSKAVLWAESHDDYMHNNSSGMPDEQINKAWAIVASRANASALFFSRPVSGAKMGDIGNINYRSDVVAAVNKFHTKFVGQSEYLSKWAGYGIIERGNSGVVIVNINGDYNVNLKMNAITDGTYYDQISGNQFTVSGGNLSGSVSSCGVAVLTKEALVLPSYTVKKGISQLEEIEVENVKPFDSTDRAVYNIELEVGEKVTISDGERLLTLGESEETIFTAKIAGMHTFYVNSSEKVYVSEPQEEIDEDTVYTLSLKVEEGKFASGSNDEWYVIWFAGNEADLEAISFDGRVAIFKVLKTYGAQNIYIKRVNKNNHGENWNEIATTYTPGDCTFAATSWTSGEWEVISQKVNISFNKNGGNGSMYDQEIEKGRATALKANTFTRQGYNFLGWAETANGEVLYQDGANVTLNEDKELFAKWQLIPYEIEYDLAGGLATNPESYTIISNDIILNNPTKTGYTFTGWTGTDLDELTMEVTIALGSTGNRSYEAHFAINQYTISFDTKGGSEIAAITQDYNTAVIAPANPTKTGYTFSGWDKAFPSTMPAENITLTAVWEAHTYTIKFDAVDENATGEMADQVFSYDEAKALTANGFSVSEKIFYRWRLDIENHDPRYFYDKEEVLNLSEEDDDTLTLKAEWTDKLAINFNLNGGEGSFDSALVAPNEMYNLPEGVPTKVGYTFTGWLFNEVSYQPSAEVEVTTSMTFVAQWQAKTYTLLGSATNGTLEWNKDEALYGSEVSYTITPDTGYTISPLNGNLILNSDNFALDGLTATKNFVCGLETYTITYHSNGGSLVDDEEFNILSNDITLPTPTKNGYSFGGWFTNNELSGDPVAKVSKGTHEDKEFYAKWNIINYTITYHLLTGAVNSNPTEYNIETNSINLEDASLDNYTFVGWYSDVNYENEVTSIAKGSTGNKDLYGKFIMTYAVKINNGELQLLELGEKSNELDQYTTHLNVTRGDSLSFYYEEELIDGFTFEAGDTNNIDNSGKVFLSANDVSIFYKSNKQYYLAGYNPLTAGTYVAFNGNNHLARTNLVIGDNTDAFSITLENNAAEFSVATKSKAIEARLNNEVINSLSAGSYKVYINNDVAYLVKESSYSYGEQPMILDNEGLAGDYSDQYKYVLTFTEANQTLANFKVDGVNIDLSKIDVEDNCNAVKAAGVIKNVNKAKDATIYLKVKTDGTGYSLYVSGKTDIYNHEYSLLGTFNSWTQGQDLLEFDNELYDLYIVKELKTTDEFKVKTGENGWIPTGLTNLKVNENGYYRISLTPTATPEVVVTKLETYTITYNNNGGTGSVSAKEVVKGTEITLDNGEGLSRDGYSFGGWALSNDGEAISNQYIPTANVTLYAVWNQIEYTIDSTVEKGSIVWKKNDQVVTKAHYGDELAYFITADLGYQAPANGNLVLNNENFTIVDDVATKDFECTIINYTITYHLDGGTATNPATYTILSNDIILSNPTKTGYTFAGWTGTDLAEATMAVTIIQGSTGAKEYTATWAAAKVNYQVKHYQQNILNNEYTLVDTDNLQGYTGAKTEALAKVYTGFNALAFEQATIKADGSTVVEIRYDRNTFTITWKNGEDVLEEDEDVKYGAMPSYDGATPTAAGKNFSGWDPIVVAVTEDATYQAQFSSNPVVTLVVAPNGYGTVSVNEFDVVADSSLTFDGANIKLGEVVKATATAHANTAEYTYQFVNWTKDEQALNSLEITESITINANFSRSAVEYAVTYAYTNTPTGAPNVPASANHAFGSQVSVSANPSLTGYTFSGWTTSDADVDDGSFTMPAKAVAFTGTWTLNTYTVTFNKNDGTQNPATSTQEFSHGVEEALDANTFARLGYEFKGWALSPSGEKEYDDEAQYTATANVTLYALWDEIYVLVVNGETSHKMTYTVDSEHDNSVSYNISLDLEKGDVISIYHGSTNLNTFRYAYNSSTSGDGVVEEYTVPIDGNYSFFHNLDTKSGGRENTTWVAEPVEYSIKVGNTTYSGEELSTKKNGRDDDELYLASDITLTAETQITFYLNGRLISAVKSSGDNNNISDDFQVLTTTKENGGNIYWDIVDNNIWVTGRYVYSINYTNGKNDCVIGAWVWGGSSYGAGIYVSTIDNNDKLVLNGDASGFKLVRINPSKVNNVVGTTTWIDKGGDENKIYNIAQADFNIDYNNWNGTVSGTAAKFWD